MCVDRRDFLRLSAGAAGLAALYVEESAAAAEISANPLPNSIGQPQALADKVVPITDAERRARIEKAQRLMVENKIDAIYLESGSSLFYYTSVRWGNSERMFAAVIPARGEIAWITPKFEEARARELIRFGKDIRAWEEDESPYRVVTGIFKDRGIRTGRIGMEERVRFFLFDGIRQEAKHLDYVSADPVTVGCRVIKSPAEIALLQRANDITLAAFKNAAATLKEGMTQYEFGAQVSAAFRALGSSGSALIGFGQYTAFPHGSIQPQQLKEGDVVLMDGGCNVEGYQSDITRTFVFGKPTQRQRDIWNLERKAQDAAFAAAKPGAACEAVDAAARKVITEAGFGPDYKVPGLPHRTGHGIGLDGHEWTNFVRGNKTKLQPGMCFSDEPMIAIYGEFGIRLEDCLYITEDGARFFTKQSASIDQPFG
ncbi:MAG: aminopeptidase P family protein [Acidobacteria bacterium]|nr:aminopeptidase P family protein [Acidobacteriota bacterium]MBI3424798.1 aminopeptidase P family protein [Acidobacteriota bacterium]